MTLHGTVTPEGAVLIEWGAEAPFPTETFIIDTGFNGHILVPSVWLDRLEAPRLGSARVVLADGRLSTFTVHAFHVSFLGVSRTVEVLGAPDAEPLVGAGLLAGCLLAVDFLDRTATITRADA